MSWYKFTTEELDEMDDELSTRLCHNGTWQIEGELHHHEHVLVVEPSGMDHLKLDKDPVSIFEKPTNE